MTRRGIQMREGAGHFARRSVVLLGVGQGRVARNGGLRQRATRGLRVLAASAVVFGLTTAPALAASSNVVNPGTGTAPPGAGQLKTILSYLAWGVTAMCVAGVLIASGKMAVSHHRGGGGGEHAGALAWVLMAAVLAGSASALVGALV